MRSVIFANGNLTDLPAARAAVQDGDLLIAADGGARHCRELGLTPAVIVGDFDSLDDTELLELQRAGVELERHPARKDFTDLELALRRAVAHGADEILVLGALGARWDQTLANLLLPAAADLRGVRIRLLDGPQEITLLQGGETLAISGQPGDTVSLVPLGGDAQGVVTSGLEYPLDHETLFFGATRGVSNTLLGESASARIKEGLLLCVVIHNGS